MWSMENMSQLVNEFVCSNFGKWHWVPLRMFQCHWVRMSNVPTKVQTKQGSCLIIKCQWFQLGPGHLDNNENKLHETQKLMKRTWNMPNLGSNQTLLRFWNLKFCIIVEGTSIIYFEINFCNKKRRKCNIIFMCYLFERLFERCVSCSKFDFYLFLVF
jgi:hypothetical protein